MLCVFLSDKLTVQETEKQETEIVVTNHQGWARDLSGRDQDETRDA